MISHTEENYLKALHNLTGGTGETNVNAISRHLNIKMPTVNSMIKRLGEKGLVIYESYKPIKLSAKGRKIAAIVIRKHRLTEMYLVEKMGFGWEEVHQIAEQIEHIQSPVFFDKMDKLLDYPNVDPHGSPIPDKNGNILEENYLLLKDCKIGDQVIFMAVQPSSEELLKYLNMKNLVLGAKISIINIEPFDESITIRYDGARNAEILSSKVTSKLMVQHCK